MLLTEAPNTLWVPISFVRCVTTGITIASKPMHESVIAMTVPATKSAPAFLHVCIAVQNFHREKNL
jgi:hypothetical protein